MARCYICDFSTDVPASDYYKGLLVPHDHITMRKDDLGRPVCSLCDAAEWANDIRHAYDGELELLEAEDTVGV